MGELVVVQIERKLTLPVTPSPCSVFRNCGKHEEKKTEKKRSVLVIRLWLSLVW